MHHIAFSTRDAAVAVDAAEAHGAPLLHLPANDYEDLVARFNLGDTEVAELSKRTSYDGDPRGGTFRHAYTHAFHDRFFLELVERRAGYDGFGAANAAVRMAAR